LFLAYSLHLSAKRSWKRCATIGGFTSRETGYFRVPGRHLSPRSIQAVFGRARGSRHSQGQGSDRAYTAAFLCHASAGRQRGSEVHPGIVRARGVIYAILRILINFDSNLI
jgi:hypothetical protein